MLDKLELLRDRSCIELIDPDLFVVLAGEKVATIRKNDLTALLDLEFFVSNQLLALENVHETDCVAETNHQVDSARVESDCMSLLFMAANLPHNSQAFVLPCAARRKARYFLLPFILAVAQKYFLSSSLSGICQ